jgi:hypothetical protein
MPIAFVPPSRQKADDVAAFVVGAADAFHAIVQCSLLRGPKVYEFLQVIIVEFLNSNSAASHQLSRERVLDIARSYRSLVCPKE